MIDPLGPVPLDEVAAEFGVPKAQIARWCADGTLERGDDYTGFAGSPSTLRITGEGLQKLRDGLTQAS